MAEWQSEVLILINIIKLLIDNMKFILSFSEDAQTHV